MYHRHAIRAESCFFFGFRIGAGSLTDYMTILDNIIFFSGYILLVVFKKRLL